MFTSRKISGLIIDVDKFSKDLDYIEKCLQIKESDIALPVKSPRAGHDTAMFPAGSI
jgi:hypothetical protein